MYPFLVLVLFAAMATAAPREVRLRAYLHSPVNPSGGTIVLRDHEGAPVAVPWRMEGWSEVVTVKIEGNEFVFTGEDGRPAARAAIAGQANEVLVVLARDSGPNASPPYRAITLDASSEAFPWGSSRVVSLLGGAETAIQAGEHRLVLPPGKITKVPPVTKRDEFNMAQVDFYLRQGNGWTPFTERRLQFVPDTRRVFIVHATPGSRQPFVTTIIDHQPQPEPGS